MRLPSLRSSVRSVPENVLAAQWELLDEVASHSVEGSVAWRRLAREMEWSSGEALRDAWLRHGGCGSPLLPSVEPWQYDSKNIVGLLDGKSVDIRPRPLNGDLALSHSLVFAIDGAAYELGIPSDEQISTWATPKTTPFLKDAAALAAAPLSLATAAIAMGIMTHHLQIDVFII